MEMVVAWEEQVNTIGESWHFFKKTLKVSECSPVCRRIPQVDMMFGQLFMHNGPL